MHRLLLAAIMAIACAESTARADWPTYRGDAERKACTQETLPSNPALEWTYQTRHAPAPAWQGKDMRMPFDRACHTVIAGGRLFFGTSADDKVHALDAATGRPLWTFRADGPVRFAPAAWKDRIFVVSDDGHLYCLASADGTVLWKRLGGPHEDKVLGNGRMISRWPARGGPVIRDDIVYFAAGIWPSEQIYIHALDAATGKVRWINGTSGMVELDQPHPTARACSGVSAQGYLVATEKHLIVPTGRAVPAVLNRGDGSFLYFHLQTNGQSGGAEVAATAAHFFNSGIVFNLDDGSRLGTGLPTATLAVAPDALITVAGSALVTFDPQNLFTEKETTDRKGEKQLKKVLNPPTSSVALPEGASAVSAVVAGSQAVVGLQNADGCSVALADLPSRRIVWTAPVDGVPYGLAVADGRLYVSTDRGAIHCFSATASPAPRVIKPPTDDSPYGDNSVFARATEEIIRKTGISKGYCLDLGCGRGQLAFELARRTNLQIVAIDPDPENVRTAREKLDAAGLYGTRVTVHTGALRQTPYPKYFANLIVSGRSITESAIVPMQEASRIQRPFGGVVCVGWPGAMTANTRGPLEGSGTWTHQYADTANTCCSGDRLAKAPLDMLWWTDSTWDMPSRHGRGPAPLFSEGRLFVEGMDGIRAVDAYNGHVLWEYGIPNILAAYDGEHLVGTAATGSNYCMADGIIYVAVENRCIPIDAPTGAKLGEIIAPPRPDGKPGTWGYIACRGGTLFGSLANEEHIVKHAFLTAEMNRLFSESVLFFALDSTTGKLKWTYTPRRSIRHNTIAVTKDTVYLIDRPLNQEDRIDYEAQKAKRRGQDSRPATAAADMTSSAASEPASEPEPPVLLALDARTGAVRWETDKDVFGTLLAASEEHGVLLMSYQFTRFKLASERAERLRAYRLSGSDVLWDVPVARSKTARFSSRPVINDRTVYLEPHAYDLLTGKLRTVEDPAGSDPKPWQLDRSYACGIVSSSADLMLFRSATLGYVDLAGDEGVVNYGGIRPGCWINAIPAGGVVLLPDATARCVCSYLNKAWIALQTTAD